MASTIFRQVSGHHIITNHVTRRTLWPQVTAVIKSFAHRLNRFRPIPETTMHGPNFPPSPIYNRRIHPLLSPLIYPLICPVRISTCLPQSYTILSGQKQTRIVPTWGAFYLHNGRQPTFTWKRQDIGSDWGLHMIISETGAMDEWRCVSGSEQTQER